MRKALFSIFAMAALLMSCQQPELKEETKLAGQVTVTFNVQYPEASRMTKALAENPTITNLYVAVFDGGGYPITFVQATDVTPKTGATNTWTYSVTLPTSSEERRLHFIANSPITSLGWAHEDDAIGRIITENEYDAYWQRKILMTGIPDDVDAAKEAIGTVSLVRNFAKVVVTCSDEDFTLESIKVYNTPDKSYLAPRTAAGQFIMNYNSTTYEDLTTSFGGWVPEEATLQTNFAESAYKAVNSTTGEAVDYVYERALPTSNPIYIIAKGKRAGDTNSQYYKINLQDQDDNYYALLRNFVFKVDIRKIAVDGSQNIGEAQQSQGSGNISTATEYENVTDITYGAGRLAVDKTSITVQRMGDFTIKYKFIPDTETGTVNNNYVLGTTGATAASPVTLSISDALTTSGPVLAEDFTVDSADEDGWRTIRLRAKTPVTGYLCRQELYITGLTASGSKIQRKVTITLAQVFSLYIKSDLKVPEVKGSPITVSLGLEKDLPRDIFPVIINIESAAKSIDPAPGTDMPVTSGMSLVIGSNQPSFMYSRTITYDEYAAVPESKYFQAGVGVIKTYIPVECEFVTNVAHSATTIYAGGNEMFNKSFCSFINGDAFTFSDTGIDDAYVGLNKTTTLRFTLSSAPARVKVSLTNATHNGQSTFYLPADNTQTLDENEIVTLDDLLIDDFGGQVIATISDDQGEYRSVTLTGKRKVKVLQNALEGNVTNDATNRNVNDAVTIKAGISGAVTNNVQFHVATKTPVVTDSFSNSVDNGESSILYTYPQLRIDSFNSQTKVVTYTITNLESGWTTRYRIDNSDVKNGTELTYNSSHQYTLNLSSQLASANSVTVYVGKKRNNGNNYNTSSFTITKSSTTVYNYNLAGPNSNTDIVLADPVEDTDLMYFTWTSGSRTMTASSTIEQVITGTAGNAGHLNFQ